MKKRTPLFGSFAVALASIGQTQADTNGAIIPADGYEGAHGQSFDYHNLNARSITGGGGGTGVDVSNRNNRSRGNIALASAITSALSSPVAMRAQMDENGDIIGGVSAGSGTLDIDNKLSGSGDDTQLVEIGAKVQMRGSIGYKGGTIAAAAATGSDSNQNCANGCLKGSTTFGAMLGAGAGDGSAVTEVMRV